MIKIKRHETIFPIEKNILFETLSDMWEKGWFDDYSEEHFLIRAINGDSNLWNRLIKNYNACTMELDWKLLKKSVRNIIHIFKGPELLSLKVLLIQHVKNL